MAYLARIPRTIRPLQPRTRNIPRHFYVSTGVQNAAPAFSSINTRFFCSISRVAYRHILSRILLVPSARGFSSGDQPPHQVLTMPALSPTMNQGNVTSWKKKEGDAVAVGDVLCEIETDKATLDYESLEEGFLAKILVPAGSKDVPVGQSIAILVELAEDIAKVTASGTKEMKNDEAGKEAEFLKESHSQEIQASSHPSLNRLGPSVRRLLAESGLEISSVIGTGPRGIVLKGDVLAALKPGSKQVKPAQSGKLEKLTRPPLSSATSKPLPQASLPSSSSLTYEDLPVSQIRKVIAKRLWESKNGIPHFYLSADATLDATLALRKELKENHGLHVSVNDFVIRAAALALSAVPEANCYWNENTGEVVPGPSIDISIAVATEKGLMTPILRNADQKSLSDISSEVKLLATKAREGKLAPHEFQGGTFSISNLGMFSVDHFCAIINPPQACILAVGRGQQVVIWDENEKGQGKPCSATKMTLTLSADHRVFNSDIGGQYLDALSGILKDPRKILL